MHSRRLKGILMLPLVYFCLVEILSSEIMGSTCTLLSIVLAHNPHHHHHHGNAIFSVIIC